MEKPTSAVFVALLLLVSLALSACYPTGSVSSSNSADPADASIPESLHEELTDSLSVDAAVSFDPNLQWKNIVVEYKAFNQEKCLELFASGKDISERIDTFSSTLIQQEDAEASVYQFSDGSGLVVDYGCVDFRSNTYTHRFYNSVLHSVDSPYTIRDDLSSVYSLTNLEDVDREYAVDLVGSIVDGLGIAVEPTPNVYALDYDTLMSEWDDFKLKDGTPATPWVKADEAYVIEYRESIDGLPVTNAGYIDEERGMAVSGGRIYGVVSEEGLIGFSCSGIFEPISSQASNLVSLDVALDSITKKYQSLIITNPITITNISATLIPYCISVEPYEMSLMPVWIFSTSQTTISTITETGEDVEFTLHFNDIINGETGAVMRLGGRA